MPVRKPSSQQPVNKQKTPDPPKRNENYSFTDASKLYTYCPYYIDGGLVIPKEVDGGIKIPDFGESEAILIGPVSGKDRMDYSNQHGGGSISAKVRLIGRAISIMRDAQAAAERYYQIYQEFLGNKELATMQFMDYMATNYPGIIQAMNLFDEETDTVFIPKLHSVEYTVVNIEAEIIYLISWLGCRNGKIVDVNLAEYAKSPTSREAYITEPISQEYLQEKIIDVDHLYSPAAVDKDMPRWMEFLAICHLWNNPIEQSRVDSASAEEGLPVEEEAVPLVSTSED